VHALPRDDGAPCRTFTIARRGVATDIRSSPARSALQRMQRDPER
jgi:hypothetical protein